MRHQLPANIPDNQDYCVMLIVFAKIYLALVAIMSVVAFVLFGVDKRRAIKESKSRSPEKRCI